MAASRIVLTQTVGEYRRTVPECVRGSDSVLEVGCATGKTTKIVSAYAHEVLAIDKSARVYEAADHGLANVRFERWDAWDVDSILSVAPRFDVIYVDISGSGLPEIAMRLVRCYEAAFGPSVIVVKNERLKAFAARCQVWGADSGATLAQPIADRRRTER